MSLTNDRLTRIRAGGAIGPADAEWLLAEIERLRAALEVTAQALREVNHAQECGPEWYTRGAQGLRQQVRMWVRKGQDAAREALADSPDEPSDS
jgi:hypothetical protein